MKDKLLKFHDNLEGKIEDLKKQEEFLSKHNFHVESLAAMRVRIEIESLFYTFRNEFKEEMK